MGQAVIGGVITSSLLTLVVVPVVYCYLDDLSVWLGRVLGMKTATASPQVEASTSGQADRIHK
jgi:HAE1 family hydrophobic/amphiphilic exporter-1